MLPLEERSPELRSAVEYIRTSSTNTSNNTKLEVYALFKSLTVARAPVTKCPGIWEMTERAKWTAWDKASRDWQDKSDEDLEARYIEIAKQLGWSGVATPSKEPEADVDDKKEETKIHRNPLGVSVSAMARPPDEPQEDENSLHSAVLSGDAGKVEDFISVAGHGLDLDQKDQYGFTALHLAADRGYLDIVKVLVKKGANLGVKDPDGLTAISLAQESNHEDIETYLEEFAAEKGTIGQGA